MKKTRAHPKWNKLATPSRPDPSASLRVLVIENDGTQESVRDHLGEGFNVQRAPTLHDARCALDAETFDLILLDIRLHDAAAMESIAHLKEAAEDSAIAFWNGREGGALADDSPTRASGFLSTDEAPAHLFRLAVERQREFRQLKETTEFQEVSAVPLPPTLRERKLTASAGVDRAPAQASTIEEVIAAVAAPLEVAKFGGERRVAAGSNDMNHLSLSDDANPIACFLSDARCLRVVSQCIVRMVDGVAVAHELLVRGPRGDLESPEVLFSLASSANSLVKFDLNCLRATMAMRARLPLTTRCHVNVDPETLIVTPIATVLDIVGPEHGPDELCIELSEQQLVGSPMRLRDARIALRAQGIGVALDHVGFGHSSLEALIVLEPDVVKIDRRLVQGVSRDAGKARALRRLACVVQGLGAEAIAEGVESLSDIGALRRIGIEFGQGYFWDTPSEIVALSPKNAVRAL